MTDFTPQSFKDAKESQDVIQDTPVVDTPAVEVIPEAQPPVDPTTTENKSTFFDKFKPEEVKNDPVKEVPDELKTRLEQLEARDKRLKELEENPHIKLLAGEKDLRDLNITDWLKKSVGEDMSKYSNEDLFRQKLQAKYPSVSKEDLEVLVLEEMDEFNKLSEARQKAERGSLVSQLSKEPEPNDLIKSLKDIQEGQMNYQEPQQLIEQAFDNQFKQAESYMVENAAQLEGQTYMGHTYSKEDCDQAVKMWKEDIQNFSQEKQLFNYAKLVAYEKNLAAADQRGYERGLKEKSNPSQNSLGNPVINPKDSQGGIKTATKDDFRNAKNINP